jgi:hypothetical protein
MKHAFTFILACGLLGLPLAGQQIRFEGAGLPLPTNLVVTLRAELGRLVASHRALFRKAPAADFKITYHITRTEAEYAERVEEAGRSPRGMPGFTRTQQRWQIKPQRRLIAAESTIETWHGQRTNELMAVLLHESAHAVTAGFLGATPLWFTEGSAELLGTPAASRYKLRRQDEAERWRLLAELLESGRMPPLRGFLEAGDYAAWDRLFEGRRALAYTASYSLFFFFSAQPAVFAYLNGWLDTKALEEGEDLNRAFADYLDGHWPGGLAAFERTWHGWIRAKAAASAPAPAQASRPGGRQR